MLFSAGSSYTAASGRALGILYQAVVQQANMLATLDAFRLLSLFFLVALPLLLLLEHYDPQTMGRPAH